MNNFREEIKLLKDEEKIKIYKHVLYEWIMLGKQDSFGNDTYDNLRRLSDDEITAIIFLANELNKCVRCGENYLTKVPERKRLRDFLFIDNDFNGDNLLIFINAITHDMRECRKYTITKGNWKLHIKRIFQVLDGENPYKLYEETEARIKAIKQKELNNSKLKLIKGGKYDE